MNVRWVRPVFRRSTCANYSTGADTGHNHRSIETKPTSDRGADLIGIELLAFDLAALHHVLGERSEDGFLSQPEAERLHLADQAPLQVLDAAQHYDQPLTASKRAALTKSSSDTSLRDIQQLVERGVLVRDQAGGRSTSYSLAGL